MERSFFFFFFIKDHSYSHLPSDLKRSALYATHLIHTQCSPNFINIAIYAIQWAHVLNVFFRSNLKFICSITSRVN